MIFLKTPPKFHWFFANVNASLQSRRYYSGFWSRGTWPSAESLDRGPRRNAHYTCTVKGREKSRMRTTYQNTSMRFGFFRACAFRAKNPECYRFFWQCKRYNKKPRFLDFGFCQCKWALYGYITKLTLDLWPTSRWLYKYDPQSIIKIPNKLLYKPLFSRTVISAFLDFCGNSRVVNFAIFLMLSLL